MPLYNVTIEGVIVVKADSDDAALKAAEDIIAEAGILSEDLVPGIVTPILAKADLVESWDEHCIPHNQTDGRTIKAILDASNP